MFTAIKESGIPWEEDPYDQDEETSRDSDRDHKDVKLSRDYLASG